MARAKQAKGPATGSGQLTPGVHYPTWIGKAIRPDDRPRVKVPARYTAKQLLAVAAWFRANPGGVAVIHDGDGSTGHDLTAAGWFAWFRRCLADKINARDPRFPAGRKAGDDYQRELDRLRPYVGSRLVLHWVAPCLGPRVRKAMADRMPDRD